MTLHFCYNPTSWANGRPVPGGMADALIQPIVRHLEPDSWTVGPKPLPHHTNVYFTFRETYGVRRLVPGETSVFISHGIADKAWRNAPKLGLKYDWVFVSGPAWVDRLLNAKFRPDRIIEAGYTKLDPVFNGELTSEWVEPHDRVRVVYAPTHGGGGEKFRRSVSPPHTAGARRSSYWQRDELVSLLPACDVRVALHPRHRADGRSTLVEYVGADVVVADGGSTIYEAWALGLPVVFPSWLTAQANLARDGGRTFEAHIYREQLGYHAATPQTFPGLVERAAREGIDGAAVEFIETIFPAAYRGQSGRLHADALARIARGA